MAGVAALRVAHRGDPRPGAPTAVSGEAHDFLTGIVKRIAAAGRLRVSVEAAASMVHTAGVGATLGLIAAQFDGQLPAHATLSHDVRDAVFAAILTPDSHEPAGGDGGPSAASRAAAPVTLPPAWEPPVAKSPSTTGGRGEVSTCRRKISGRW